MKSVHLIFAETMVFIIFDEVTGCKYDNNNKYDLYSKFYTDWCKTACLMMSDFLLYLFYLSPLRPESIMKYQFLIQHWLVVSSVANC